MDTDVDVEMTMVMTIVSIFHQKIYFAKNKTGQLFRWSFACFDTWNNKSEFCHESCKTKEITFDETESLKNYISNYFTKQKRIGILLRTLEKWKVNEIWLRITKVHKIVFCKKNARKELFLQKKIHLYNRFEDTYLIIVFLFHLFYELHHFM
jgi:hypothetical protein